MAKKKSNGTNGKVALMVAVVVVSAWVNRDFITGLFGSSDASLTSANGATHDPTMYGPVPGGLPPGAVPIGETKTASGEVDRSGRIAGSKLPTERLPDPFLHPPAEGAKTKTDTAPVAITETSLPVVSMLMQTNRGAVALVDGRLVGVGDRIAFGIVEAMTVDRVVVRNEAGERIELPLQTSGARKVTRPAKKSDVTDADPADAPATGGTSPSLVDNLQTLLNQTEARNGATPPAATGATRR